MNINDSHLIGFVVGLLLATAMELIERKIRSRKKSTKFKKGDKRTKLLARLGGYSRWDRDGKRYGDKKPVKKSTKKPAKKTKKKK